MRRRFFVSKFENQRVTMEGEAAHHVGRVLRAQPGQLYELSDGNSVWLARIDSVSKENVEFSLVEEVPGYIPLLKTTLLLSIVKFESFEWAIEKACELGVTRIVPLAAARSEKGLLAASIKRADRWTKILAESSQQCRRVQLPILSPIAKPEEAFEQTAPGLHVLLSESPEAQPLRTVLTNFHGFNATLAIGPEGGWTEKEFSAARDAQFSEASLGRLILRTETAVVASLAALNFALSND
jgi:16S rRNA (uracil1498-N3)-methyltransferase